MSYVYKRDKDNCGTNVIYYIDIETCDYCGKGKIVRDMKNVQNTGYGSHTDRITLKWIAGGLVNGLLVCDACATISSRLRDVKDLEYKKKKILKELDNLSESLTKALDEIKVDKTVVEERIKNVRK